MGEVGAFLVAALKSHIFWGTVTGLGTIFLAATALVMYTKSRRNGGRAAATTVNTDGLVQALLTRQIGETSDAYHAAVDYAPEQSHLTYAVDWLSEQAQSGGDRQRVTAALTALRKGDTRPAEVLFKSHMDLARNEGNNTYASWMARHLGALASVRDVSAAMAAYADATAVDPTEPDGWNRVGLLYRRNGQYDEAAEIFEKVLSLVTSAENPQACAIAAGNLGLIHRARGEADDATDRFIESLSLNEVLNDHDAMIRDYSNLGFLYDARGDLEKATALHRRALSLAQEAGRQEAVADSLTNIGLALEAQDDMAGAEDAYRQAYTLNEQLGRPEGTAAALSYLALALQDRGDLEEAEQCHRHALAINEARGSVQSTAADYGNLGVIHQMKGELEQAEACHRQALSLNEQLGRKDGMANQLGNLGLIYQSLDNADAARQCFENARDLFLDLGDTDKAEQVAQMISSLDA